MQCSNLSWAHVGRVSLPASSHWLRTQTLAPLLKSSRGWMVSSRLARWRMSGRTVQHWPQVHVWSFSLFAGSTPNSPPCSWCAPGASWCTSPWRRRRGRAGLRTSSRVGPILFGTRLRRLTFVLTHEVFKGPICGRSLGSCLGDGGVVALDCEDQWSMIGFARPTLIAAALSYMKHPLTGLIFVWLVPPNSLLLQATSTSINRPLVVATVVLSGCLSCPCQV